MASSAGPFLDDLLVQAARRVRQEYLDLDRIASGSALSSQVRLERVYTYELYHQMRTLMPDHESTAVPSVDARWRLHGEVDKSGSSIPGRLVPDFIWHVPGQNDNGLVIEVKRASARRSALLADVAKLEQFLKFGYKRAILLIVGDFSPKRLDNLLAVAGGAKNDSDARVQILLHQKAEEVVWAPRPLP